MFILASSVCKSLQYLTSALTQGSKGGHLFRLTCSIMLWRGRSTANKYHWHVWGFSECLGHTGFVHTHSVCAFVVYTAQAPGCSARELPKEGPGLHALPRSKPLRFRFLGPPQRHKLGWTCVLCPSQVRAAQTTRCLASTLSPGGRCILSPPWSWPLGFSSCAVGASSQVCRVSPLGS